MSVHVCVYGMKYCLQVNGYTHGDCQINPRQNLYFSNNFFTEMECNNSTNNCGSSGLEICAIRQ